MAIFERQFMGKEKSWVQRIAGKCFCLLPVIALLAAGALADTRKPVANPVPEYPEIARRMNITGMVRMEIVIAADGTIKSVKAIGGHPLLVDAVEKALKKWKYVPAGTETTMQLDFKF